MKKFGDPCVYTIEIQRFEFKTCHVDRTRKIVMKLWFVRGAESIFVLRCVFPVRPCRGERCGVHWTPWFCNCPAKWHFFRQKGRRSVRFSPKTNLDRRVAVYRTIFHDRPSRVRVRPRRLRRPTHRYRDAAMSRFWPHETGPGQGTRYKRRPFEGDPYDNGRRRAWALGNLRLFGKNKNRTNRLSGRHGRIRGEVFRVQPLSSSEMP